MVDERGRHALINVNQWSLSFEAGRLLYFGLFLSSYGWVYIKVKIVVVPYFR